MIHRTPFIMPWLYPSLVWRMLEQEKVLYLTFDDGPVPGPTEFVLDTLSQFSAQATFFCIGDNVRKHPEIFRKIVNNGHAIGNHTFNHLNGWKTDNQVYLENIRKCDEVLNENGKRVDPSLSLFRPPYGRITKNQIQSLSSYKIIMWDVLSIDYNKNLSSASCLANTVNACRAGSIVVFHDSYKAERNMTYALPRLLRHFADEGYSFKAIPS
jgi:peptidoglycan-N-acetylglucosamine deacetylase